MLIKWTNENDINSWLELATEVSPVFQHPSDMSKDSEFFIYIKNKISKYEALTAIDYMSGKCMGFIGFSRTHNRISWFAVSEKYRNKNAGNRLLKTALRQLNTNKDITVTTFRNEYIPGLPARNLYNKYGFTLEKLIITENGLLRSELTRPASVEKRGSSFHYKYPDFIKAAQKEFCPACNDEPSPNGQYEIEINENVWIVAEYPGQGRLFGKMYVMPRKHFFHFEDMNDTDVSNFMIEVKRVGKSLKKITGAEKINYEMHSNSGAHLHIHLFPRYLDDDFPSAPIDYRQTEPAPYESFEEFLWFIKQMKKDLLSKEIY